ncbi:MAG: B3/B4 domain-containing protein [Promethearchaeota archaeon]|jgi:DNA/RNA-binding domain of Phe-tRNA-synthetase-like protein
MKSLKIAPEIFNIIPNLVVISGFLEIGEPDKTGISSYLNESWENLTKEVRIHGHTTHPQITKWRKALQTAKISVKKFPPSIQAIAKRTLQSNIPFSINSIVDAYNAISMDLVIPGGGYDLHQMDGGLQLRTSKGGEDFLPIGKSASSLTFPNEIVYSDESDILTRQFLWQQSEKAKITTSTTSIVFVFELLSDMGPNLIEKARNTIDNKFRNLLNGSVSEILIHRK